METVLVIVLVVIFLAVVAVFAGIDQSWRRQHSRRPSQRRRHSYTWVEPEVIPGQDERDAELGRTAFYTYVLSTDDGYYVGHTWHVGTRLRQHETGMTAATAGKNPRLAWVSHKFGSRAEASKMEAALKHCLHWKRERFPKITGL